MRLTSAVVLLPVLCGLAGVQAQTISLDVDASAITRKLVSAREHIPATPGPLTLVYPDWIPGDHGPVGPITDLVGVRFTVDGKPVPWRRDLVDMYAFHLVVPEGATAVDAEFAAVSQFAAGNDFNLGNTSTPVQGDLNWDQLVLYKAGDASDNVRIEGSVKLPHGWSYATALPADSRDGDTLHFAETSLTTLVDSPVMMGSFYRQFDITPKGETRRHTLNIFGESAADLPLPQERVDGFRNLVAETGALFGARHYHDYHFLVEAHDESDNGLEHHQSSDDQVPEMAMVTPAWDAETGYLLAHEMTHSWNGKFRRPAGLATRNYQDPMTGELLWVYEGLTSYWGEVLDVRSGLESAEDFQDRLATAQSMMAWQTGRDWRPLQDTADAAQLLYLASSNWESLRRSTDYYDEGKLLWLEVDSIIRTQTKGRHSLDDFARAFYGGPSLAADAEPRPVPYTFDDVVKALNSIAPYDWSALFRKRLAALRPDPPTPGLEAAGWQVVYTGQQNKAERDAEAGNGDTDLRASIGLVVDSAGKIVDVVLDSAAGRATMAPEVVLAAVNQRVYSPEVLRDAITAAQTDKQPITLMVLNGSYYSQYSVNYTDGLRYPHLARLAAKPDLLQVIEKPLRQP